VQQCSPPSANVKQLQCCCNTSVCGAGMLDAASAVSAVAALRADPWLKTAAPQAGAVLELDGAGSSTPAGRSKVVPQGPRARAGADQAVGLFTIDAAACNGGTSRPDATAAGRSGCAEARRQVQATS
jgi:hypothetical protein